MNSIAKIDPDKRLRLQTLLIAFRFASLLAALTLFTALPSHAWDWYSGASVGSDGTVYGWGVTDVSYYGMWHTAYVTTTITSPVKQRQMTANGDADDWVRADVFMNFDPDDTGIYDVESFNSGYCYYLGGFILWSWSYWHESLRWTKWAALVSDDTIDECNHKKRTRIYRGLDDSDWVDHNYEQWVLIETNLVKDPTCGTILTGGTENGGLTDEITIGCYYAMTCVHDLDQKLSVKAFPSLPYTHVDVKNCVGKTLAQCKAEPAHTGSHVRYTATLVTVTDN